MSNLPLVNVQSNILKYHNRKYSRFIFICFDGNANAIKDWVSTFYENFKMTSAATDLIDYKRFIKKKPNSGRLISLLFSSKGFHKMGFKKTDDGLPKDTAFWKGMQSRKTLLNDPDKKTWETGYKKTIDAMVLVADDSAAVIENTMTDLAKRLAKAKVGNISFHENAAVKTNKAGHKIEQFGFRDGLSQPKLWDKGHLLQDKWNMALDNSGGGSYLVFRKLEQNVKLFNEKVKDMSKQLLLPESYIGARVIGRYKDGVHLADGTYPVTKIVDPKSSPEYSKDPDGMGCPFHSHARKMHAASYKTRMVRRGVTYDNRLDKSNPEPENGAGILFLSYQASIENQFEVLQSKWANNPDYPKKNTGIDPLIGQTNATTAKASKQRSGYNTTKESLALNGTVTLKGGEYFYAPGIPFLRDIKSFPRKVNYSSGYYSRGLSYGLLSSISGRGYS